jgi:hypothetical protein
MSERGFRPTGRPRHPQVSDIYRRPNPSLEKIAHIFEYALTVDGYQYAQEHFHCECLELANERLGA